EQRDELASLYVEHGAPPRNPLCQLSAGLGCPGSASRQSWCRRTFTPSIERRPAAALHLPFRWPAADVNDRYSVSWDFGYLVRFPEFGGPRRPGGLSDADPTPLPDPARATNGPVAFYRTALANLPRSKGADRSTMLRGLIAFCLLRRPLVLVAYVAFLG